MCKTFCKKTEPWQQSLIVTQFKLNQSYPRFDCTTKSEVNILGQYQITRNFKTFPVRKREKVKDCRNKLRTVTIRQQKILHKFTVF